MSTYVACKFFFTFLLLFYFYFFTLRCTTLKRNLVYIPYHLLILYLFAQQSIQKVLQQHLSSNFPAAFPAIHWRPILGCIALIPFWCLEAIQSADWGASDDVPLDSLCEFLKLVVYWCPNPMQMIAFCT